MGKEKLKNLYGFETRAPDKRLTNKRSRPDIKRLWQRSHEIIGLALQGYNNRDIAKTLNITDQTVSLTLNSELGMEKLSELRKERDGEFIDVSKKIAALGEKALEMYEEIFNSDTISYNLKKATADTVLMDLGGHRAPTKIDNRNLNLTASVQEIEEFKKLGLKAAKEAGFLIEVPGELNESKEITE